jgi:hypothetical protein
MRLYAASGVVNNVHPKVDDIADALQPTVEASKAG